MDYSSDQNTGVGSCSFLQGIFPTQGSNPAEPPGKNTRVGSCSFLQGIFPTPGSNSGLPHCRQILYHLSLQGNSSFIYIYIYEKKMVNIEFNAAAAAKSLQSCPTLCDPIDSSPPGSPIPGKNTGVGCHFLLQCMKVKSETEVAQS